MPTSASDLLQKAKQRNKITFSGLVSILKTVSAHRKVGRGNPNDWKILESPNGKRIIFSFVNESNVQAEFTPAKATIYDGHLKRVLCETNKELASYFSGESAFPQ